MEDIAWPNKPHVTQYLDVNRRPISEESLHIELTLGLKSHLDTAWRGVTGDITHPLKGITRSLCCHLISLALL